MEDALIDSQNKDDLQLKKYLSFRKRYTVNSIDSLPDFDNKLYLSKIIIINSFCSIFLGLYILFNSSFYFDIKYNFSHKFLLFYYTLIFTFGIFGILIISFFFSLIIKSISSIKKCFRKSNKNNNEEILLDNNTLLLNDLENSDNIAIIPYTLSICIFLGIILYLIGFPFSFYLIYIMIRNEYYYKFNEFFVLYLFIFINEISGGIFIFVLYSFIKAKTQSSFRITSFDYDEDNLMNAYKEVKDAINLIFIYYTIKRNKLIILLLITF